MTKPQGRFNPIILALVFIFGAFVGMRLSNGGYHNPELMNISPLGFNKLNEIIHYIEQEYVDTVKKEMLVDQTVGFLLQELDPHSYYIPPKDLSSVNEPLHGNFEGVGIEFSIQEDTILVISPITGGPSEQVGIRAGDRIVEVNDTIVAGTELTNKRVMQLLRGAKGTKVKVGILRGHTSTQIQHFTITRDKIPINSVDVSFMLNDTTGYLKLSRFSRTTYEEFMQHSLTLKEKGMRKLVLDLRNNGGGYLDQAVKLADEFLVSGELIVYTKGKARPKRTYYATSSGAFHQTDICVLIDEGTASASEIISGAVQDNDRGTIIGRRSYGKGLVQEQTNWPDGSAIRLTIARYYTPTGRSIQMPYEEGSEAYHEAQYERLGSIETEIDSSAFPDSLKYFTPSGDVVYGGGGIYPDVIVPFDTTDRTDYFIALLYNGLIREYALDYVDQHRAEFKDMYTDAAEFEKLFVVDYSLLKGLYGFASEAGVKYKRTQANVSTRLISNYLKANIARYLFGSKGFYRVFNKNDKAIKKALNTSE